MSERDEQRAAYLASLPEADRAGALVALEREEQRRLVAPKTYPFAPDGIFWGIQGEGHLRGFQMGFLRLAGCSVGCPGCDTDYRVAERLTAEQAALRAFQQWPHDRDQWVWITGGEPTDHDLGPLLDELGKFGYRVALATSGVRPVIRPVDWLSVSPHGMELGQRYGQEVKLVDGLNGLDLEAWAERWDARTKFFYSYVQPASVQQDGRWTEDPASLARCLAFLRKRPHWALSRQDHHVWGVR